MSILSPGRPPPQTRGRGHGHGRRPSTIAVVMLGIVVVLALVEAGSWFITSVQLEDDATLAAVTAANEVDGLPTSAQTAATALDVAQRELTEQGAGGKIDPATLRLFEDGTVRFTAVRTAPSPVLAHIDWTKGLTEVHVDVEGRPAVL